LGRPQSHLEVLLQGDLFPYLLDRGLLNAERVAAGDASIEDLSRRNRNFKILHRDGPSYFLKQAPRGDSRETLAREAATLRMLRSLPPLASHVPRCLEYDTVQQILILEITDGHETLDRRLARTGRWPSTASAALGRFLALLHRDGTNAAAALPDHAKAGEAPWVLSIHRPDLALRWNASDANMAFIRILQGSPGIQTELDRMRAGWSRSCLIHGDIKSANILVPKRGTAARELQVIDWELSGPGDPAWDVASVWSDVLCLWLFSIPMAQDGPIEESLEAAPYPLARAWPYLRSFWNAYVDTAGLDFGEADSFLSRSLPYAAARLFQTGFESTIEAARLTTNLVCLIQLGSNILRRPREAAARLLGL
jgi:aminoglycoside phosphotransferase (APT) family kinase protein